MDVDLYFSPALPYANKMLNVGGYAKEWDVKMGKVGYNISVPEPGRAPGIFGM